MSIQAGILNVDGKMVDHRALARLSSYMKLFGPSSQSSFRRDNFGSIYSRLSSNAQSKAPSQPHLSPQGVVITWDGRLDNRQELLQRLGLDDLTAASDCDIVGAAYRQWGLECLGRLIGDWALSLWDTADERLVLAKDFLGTRHLFYSFECGRLVWATTLDTILGFAEKPLQINDRYIAEYLVSFPSTHLTPYAGVFPVPAGHAVTIAHGIHSVAEYWSFDSSIHLFLSDDIDYQEQFRELLAQSLRRRLQSERPVLAELSGGMDSSSIVSMADLVSKRDPGLARVDTISYYDSTEPNWDERPFFTKVEEARGRSGFHVNVGQITDDFEMPATPMIFSLPGATKGSYEIEKIRATYIQSHGYDVLLSGIGGDELLGGIPNPIPELAFLTRAANLSQLYRQTRAWSLKGHRPWHHLLCETITSFLPRNPLTQNTVEPNLAWLAPSFLRTHRDLLKNGCRNRLHVFGPDPVWQANLAAFHHLQKQIGCLVPSPFGNYRKSYPFLDRDLMTFVYSIPREQILRPGERRSLMRRALVGILPPEILNRRRKAQVSRRPFASIEANWGQISQITRHMMIDFLGVIDRKTFLGSLERAKHGHPEPIILILRTLQLEIWLRDLFQKGVIGDEHAKRTSRRASLWPVQRPDFATRF